MNRDADEILDELLVMRAQQGDEAATQLLVRRWHPRLIRHAQKLTERHDVAADVVQEGWLAIFRGLPRLKDPATFRAWAYRIVHHKSVDWIRQQARQREIHQEASEQPVASESVEESAEIDELRVAIGRLSLEQQVLLRLFYHEEMSLKEIAAILCVPVGTLKHRLFSLRQQLKELMERNMT